MPETSLLILETVLAIAEKGFGFSFIKAYIVGQNNRVPMFTYHLSCKQEIANAYKENNPTLISSKTVIVNNNAFQVHHRFSLSEINNETMELYLHSKNKGTFVM